MIILFYDFFKVNKDDHFAFNSKIDIFIVVVTFWFFMASIYFLWHSTNRSIVVDLITYGILCFLLSIIISLHAIDILFIQNSLDKAKNIQNDTHRKFDYAYIYMTYAELGLSIIFTIIELSILPAVYEDIKDNIFLALGGNNNLWNNFYNVTLTKSTLKLDLIFTC